MEWVAFSMFAAVVLLLLAGFPVAFSLGGTALLFAFGGVIGGGFEQAFLSGLPSRVFGIMTNDTLIAVPLFVFMGITLERARIAEELLETLSRQLRRHRPRARRPAADADFQPRRAQGHRLSGIGRRR